MRKAGRPEGHPAPSSTDAESKSVNEEHEKKVLDPILADVMQQIRLVNSQARATRPRWTLTEAKDSHQVWNQSNQPADQDHFQG